jgi:hypothetical protein
VLPSAVVRGLVARYEQEIAALTLELDAALAEAADAERSAGGHSIADVLALGLDADHLRSPEREVSTPPLPAQSFLPAPRSSRDLGHSCMKRRHLPGRPRRHRFRHRRRQRWPSRDVLT